MLSLFCFKMALLWKYTQEKQRVNTYTNAREDILHGLNRVQKWTFDFTEFNGLRDVTRHGQYTDSTILSS